MRFPVVDLESRCPICCCFTQGIPRLCGGNTPSFLAPHLQAGSGSYSFPNQRVGTETGRSGPLCRDGRGGIALSLQRIDRRRQVGRSTETWHPARHPRRRESLLYNCIFSATRSVGPCCHTHRPRCPAYPMALSATSTAPPPLLLRAPAGLLPPGLSPMSHTCPATPRGDTLLPPPHNPGLSIASVAVVPGQVETSRHPTAVLTWPAHRSRCIGAWTGGTANATLAVVRYRPGCSRVPCHSPDAALVHWQVEPVQRRQLAKRRFSESDPIQVRYTRFPRKNLGTT